MTQNDSPQSQSIYLSCSTFPEYPHNEVLRENLLETFERMFAGDKHVVAVDGPEGIGKTTLLAQFSRINTPFVLCHFVRADNRLTYDPVYFKTDLCNQIYSQLEMPSWQVEQEPADTYLRGRFSDLHRSAKAHGKFLYLIIDGLTDVPDEARNSQHTIARLISEFRLPNCRLLLSGDSDKLNSILHGSEIHPFPVPPFSLHEATHYLSDISLESDDAARVISACQKIPGHLAAARALIKSGHDPKHIDNHASLHRLQWRDLRQQDEPIQLLLAILAHDSRQRSTGDLADFLSESPDVIERLVGTLPCLTVSGTDSIVAFSSEPFRRYVANELRSRKHEVTSLVISRLMDRQGTARDVYDLSSQLEYAGRYDDILTVLTTPKLVDLVRADSTLSDLRESIDCGLRAATKRESEGRNSDSASKTL